MKRQKILILGWDGYIGFPLTVRCLHDRHVVVGVDDFSRRKHVNEMGSVSATDILSRRDRVSDVSMIGDFTNIQADISFDNDTLRSLIKRYKFDTIVNLAHNPSASHSMKDVGTANDVLINNIVGTNNILWAIKELSPESHYITIGSTGEYNHTINVDIEEGYFQFDHNGRKSAECLFPRQGNSIYHNSKISSTYIIDYLTRLWGLKCTDIMQSIVYGLYTPDLDRYRQVTRCDSDDCFGTVLNRFVVQALLGEPLTLFGHGKHQRAFLSLADSIQALWLAITNPASPGKVQTWNQLSEWHQISRVAEIVKNNIDGATIRSIPSPRKEFTGGHYYNYITDNLKSLGYKPTRTMEEEIKYMVSKINITNKEDILRRVIEPKVLYDV